ncbi:MAG: hypothetical protein CR986_01535 [Ignavibacteriae bacterium]|nr:MAG: hypothetical protein CR986_01535 [Ignavibacteriota bacterium]
MKNIIIYALFFIIAFLGTSYAVYVFNQQYANIFKFDFRTKEEVAVDTMSVDSLALAIQDSIAFADSVRIAKEDSVNKLNQKLESELDSTQTVINTFEEELSQKDKQIEHLKKMISKNENVEYAEWLKKTIKMYEEMETHRASKLLAQLSEKEARDIIYSMKKKKAADILSYMDVSTAKRLTRSKK